MFFPSFLMPGPAEGPPAAESQALLAPAAVGILMRFDPNHRGSEMGTLYYGAARTAVQIDDRILAHLKVLTGSKLRRNEPFLLSWQESAGDGHGRSSIWLHPDVDLIYRFDGNRPPELDSALLEQMSDEAISPTGVHIEAAMPRFSSR